MDCNHNDVDLENGGSKPEGEVVGPEELLRRETKVVYVSRAIMLVILIVMGGLLSLGAYKRESRAEEAAYHDGFEFVASKLATTFLSVVAQSMWSSNAVGMVVTASGDSARAAPNITIPMFETIASGAIQVAGSGQVLWSPLISDEETKKTWEAYAQQQINASIFSRGDDKCFICGNPNLEVGTPDVAVSTLSGTYTCGELSTAAQQGLIRPSDCSLFATYAVAHCSCRPAFNQTNKVEKQNGAGVTPRSTKIYELVDSKVSPVKGLGPYSPIWQVYPALEWASAAMFDLFSDPVSGGALKAMLHTQEPVVSEIYSLPADSSGNTSRARSLIFSPVFATPGNQERIIGSIAFDVDWASFINEALPMGSKGLRIVLENSFGQKHTFRTNGVIVENVGEGDLYDVAFESTLKQSSFDDFMAAQTYAAPFGNTSKSQMNCAYRISIYSSEEFRSTYFSNKPMMDAMAVIVTFVFMATLFVAYDCYAARRLRRVMTAALQRDEIVSSLFPAGVQERLFQRGQATRRASLGKNSVCTPHPMSHMRRVMSASSLSATSVSTDVAPRPEPIADFFPSVTVVFADISGFTAWSSEREPSQVFHLLETVYKTFDRIAERFGIFKIETIGDCYVAVAGLPQHQPDHAVRVVRFAYECMLHMRELTKELQSSLGTSTSSLSIRIGIHSGPVIAGVLRGDKSRFQLFGDTMNTTSRMQTTGEINMIQVSSTTAELLVQAKKSHWIRPRDQPVAVKGKGLTHTFWVDPVLSEDEVVTQDTSIEFPTLLDNDNTALSDNDKMTKLVKWNSDMLLRLLEAVVVKRDLGRKRRTSIAGLARRHSKANYGAPLDDLVEIIPIEGFLDKIARDEAFSESIDLGETVKSQLQQFVKKMASLYKGNPFHNLERASCAASLAYKAIKRVVQLDQDSNQVSRYGFVALRRANHNDTFGISSDMLVHFALVFAAFIHSVDHDGVSNSQLAKEQDKRAVRYKNRCVVEQSSVDIAWNLLMEENYRELRQCICNGEQEQQRFRHLLVNAVLATDFADESLQQQRQERWDRAFQNECDWCADPLDTKIEIDRKATIVIEYIVQASVLSYAMQQWKVYEYWSEQLFKENYLAYCSGREEEEPSKNWYQRQLQLFDEFIIPLAKKLETCGVFGASSSELLSHASENRRKWEAEGKNVVRRFSREISCIG